MSALCQYRMIAFWSVVLLITLLSFCALSFLYAAAPVFSHTSGFYEDGFQLTMTAAPYSKIYYTLDGSVPTCESLRYTEPLTIEDISGNANMHSMRTDIAAEFRTDLIEKYQPVDAGYGYQQPDYQVDKCNIIRAVSINPFGIISEVVSASYFVGMNPERYPNCNVLSLLTDPDNLFDPDYGIYVTGRIFEEYMKREEPAEHWRFWDANYRQRGPAWEREAAFLFFDRNGRLLTSEDGAIRIHGGVSRATLPRSLNVYARDALRKIDTFDYCLFGNDYKPAAVSLDAGGNQLVTLFNDYMMTQRVRNLDIATRLFEPYVLFLDGEYWGFYWLVEKFDENYFAHYYGVDPNNCVMIKADTLEIGRDEDYYLYRYLVDYFVNNDMSIPENYDKACELIDIDSCLDYFCTMVYIARDEDWPIGNLAVWRTRVAGNSPFEDTKWRWILYDCNSTSMSSYEDNTQWDTIDTARYDPIFHSLWNNQSFREAFRVRLFEIAEENFNAEEMNALIQNYTTEMEPVLAQSWKRFWGNENDIQTEYYETMERIRQFFHHRKAYVETWFAEDMK